VTGTFLALSWPPLLMGEARVLPPALVGLMTPSAQVGLLAPAAAAVVTSPPVRVDRPAEEGQNRALRMPPTAVAVSSACTG